MVNEKTIPNIKKYLVKVLKENSLYTPQLGYQIEAASSTIVMFRIIRDYIIERNEPPVVKETSREGDVRFKENPAFRLYVVFDAALRKDLRALHMNLERMKSADPSEGGDDDLTEMMESLRDD